MEEEAAAAEAPLYMEGDEDLLPLDLEDEDAVLTEGDDCDVEVEESLKVVVKTSYQAKLIELLRNLKSGEFKIHSEASKEFIKLLKGESGGELLHQYVEMDNSCSELLDAWKLRKGKPGVAHVLSLISAILDHSDGKYKRNDLVRITLSRKLDKLAREVILKLEDIHAELNCKEARRQNAALSVMAAIVRRGLGLASEVANNFDFKLPVFPKLAEYRKRTVGSKSKSLTRHFFIEFAMSFLEIGDPRLLRRVLQLRDMYFGILRGLGSDDEETVIYVLSTLRDRVLTPDSLVPSSLRSVLFGSVTLEQLITISGNPDGGPSAKIAHEVLVMVCTDPCNGLMPDLKVHTSPLKGNPRRLLELMKKLSATEIKYHRDLLLAIVRGKPFFGSTYMDEFPYLLEPRASSTWFSAISLASDLVSSTGAVFTSGSLFAEHHNPPSLDSSEMQCLLKCIVPRAFSRVVINRGLLHSDVGVRHGSMRLLLESLKSLDSFVGAIDLNSCPTNLVAQKWMLLKQKLQDEARALLPDAQVLYKLLSSLTHGDIKSLDVSLKRPRRSEVLSETHCNHGAKKLKSDLAVEDVDIMISGIAPEVDNDDSKERENAADACRIKLEREDNHVNIIAGIWGLHNSNVLGNELKDAETYFHSKLLDALTLYLRTMPMVLDGSFDFFKVLPRNPFTLTISQQQSLLSLLIEYIGWSPRSRSTSFRAPDNMHKHLHPLLDLLVYSPVKGIRDLAYILVRAAMLSTGLFDRNCLEIDAWILFLPGYKREKSSIGSQAVEVFQDWSKVVVSFLCAAVSTMRDNLYKYMDHLRSLIISIKDFAVISPDFSPLFIFTLKRCLRMLDSDPGTFKLCEKSMISMYVCNTLSFILQTQVDGRLLSSLIDLILTERFGDSSACDDSLTSFCEWRPLKNLLLLSRSISLKKDDPEDSLCEVKHLKSSLLLSRYPPYENASSSLCSVARKGPRATCHSFAKTLGETKRNISYLRGGSLVGVAKAFCSSIVCASPDVILDNFPSVITVYAHLLGSHLPFLSSIFFHEGNLLVRVANLWPDIFFSSLELVVDAGSTNGRKADALVRTTDHPSSPEESISSMDFDSLESASAAFSSFLKQASFHVLFPAVMGGSSSSLLGSSKLIDFLKGKLCEVFMDDCVACLRLLLFWVHQIQSSYRVEQLRELEQLSTVCFVLIKYMLEHILAVDSSNSATIEASMTTHIQEIAETIFHHPAVMVSLSDPLCYNKDVTNENLTRSFIDFLNSSNGSINPISNGILHLLTTVGEHLLGLGSDMNFVSEAEETGNERLVKALKTLVQQVILTFRKNFEMPISCEKLTNLLPGYYVLRALIRIIPPFMLLELANYIFDHSDTICLESVKVSAFSIGCHIADGAFDLLSRYMHQLNTKTVRSSLFWEVEGRSFDVPLFEKVFNRVLCFATHFKLECADLCLLKAVNVVYSQKFMPPQAALLPSSMAISRVIMSTPINLIDHCIHGTTATKAKLLFQLTEVSPLHLTLFGQMLFNKDLSSKENVIGEKTNLACTNEQFMMLLPVAVSYMKMSVAKVGVQYLKHFQCIPSIYSKILLDGFLNWKSFTSGDIFQEDYGELLPSSTQELLNIFSHSILGKSIHMLQFYFSLNLNSMKMKKRMKLFDSICPCPGVNHGFLDFDVNKIDVHSLHQSLNFVNRVIAKISFCRMLLFPIDNLIQVTKENGHPEEITSLVVSNEEDSPMLRFINILVKALHKIVRRFPPVTDESVSLKSTDCSQLFRYLEVFILRNIFELTVKMQNELIQMSTITFVEQFARSSLHYRFEDPTTLKVLHGILILLSEGNFSSGDIFELLLGHSKFISSVFWSVSISDSPGLLNSGMLMKPMSSALKSPFALGADQSEADNNIVSEMPPPYRQKLEVIKLLRVLYHLKTSCASIVPEEDATMNSKELLSLLLSCYGATMNEIDLEIFELMHEIVSTEASESVNIAEMDYLWGSSALKLREKTIENSLLSDNTTDCETSEERRKRQFRENLALDSKICAITILNFPYDRVVSHRPISSDNLKQDDLMGMLETSSTSIESIRPYDPAFILRFSIHGLSMGYLEPLEFASLGLLAIAYMSVSSPDEGIRKLGYAALGTFKNTLKSRRNKKGMEQLQLLEYLKHGITEPWQRIPSITATFAAEASIILLDPSHDHYRNIIELLPSPINFQCIPLFNKMFGSTSGNFRTDRLWILRLSHAGLNLDDDAQIFIRKSLVEILLSFYSSPLSDYQSKMLILQIVKKSIKLPLLARYLVQKCNLISWLSSTLSSSCTERLCDDDKSSSPRKITILLEIIDAVISAESIIEWLREHALEQLSELSSHALKLFMGRSKSIKQNFALHNSILKVLVSTLRISQERKLYQPQFSVSYDGLFQLCQPINDESNNSIAGTSAVLVLRAILMSAPPAIIPHKEGGELVEIIIWGVSTASKSHSKESDAGFLNFLGERECEDFPISKLLRWVTASVIHGSILRKSHKSKALISPENRSIQSLQLLLDHIKKVDGEVEFDDRDNPEIACDNNKALAATIMYLLQLLGVNCKVLPSVISALCLLLLSDASRNTGAISSDSIASLCSKIRCPAEANPAWRWSYHQPWRDNCFILTEVEKLEERQACESLWVIFSNLLREEFSDSQFLSHQDLVESGVFAWERNIIVSQLPS